MLWLGWFVNRAQQQRRAVEWVRELGGSVHYDFETDEYFRVNEDAKPPGPNWLRSLIGINYFADVVKVNLYDTEASDVSINGRYCY